MDLQALSGPVLSSLVSEAAVPSRPEMHRLSLWPSLNRFDAVALNPQPLPPGAPDATGSGPEPLSHLSASGFDPQPDPPALRNAAIRFFV
jgi:hypothetical protein